MLLLLLTKVLLLRLLNKSQIVAIVISGVGLRIHDGLQIRTCSSRIPMRNRGCVARTCRVARWNGHFQSLLKCQAHVVAVQRVGASMLGKATREVYHVVDDILSQDAEGPFDFTIERLLLGERPRHLLQIHRYQQATLLLFLCLPFSIFTLWSDWADLETIGVQGATGVRVETGRMHTARLLPVVSGEATHLRLLLGWVLAAQSWEIRPS